VSYDLLVFGALVFILSTEIPEYGSCHQSFIADEAWMRMDFLSPFVSSSQVPLFHRRASELLISSL
jgi:hypothetical protein